MVGEGAREESAGVAAWTLLEASWTAAGGKMVENDKRAWKCVE
jgi:hypothetical protein